VETLPTPAALSARKAGGQKKISFSPPPPPFLFARLLEEKISCDVTVTSV